jgi:hypothetical protein
MAQFILGTFYRTLPKNKIRVEFICEFPELYSNLTNEEFELLYCYKGIDRSFKFCPL